MKSFYECLIGKGPVPDAYRPAGKLSLEAAFAVYQNAYIARLTETLGDTFEDVWKVLGDELFLETCKDFIRTHPSENYNLSDYSVHFSDFLRIHPVTEEFPFLPDLAFMGWIQKETFNAPMSEGLAGEQLLAVLSEQDGKAQFVEHFRLLKSEFSLFDIWKALTTNSPPPEPWDRPQFLAFYKVDHQVYVKQLMADTYQALEEIAAGKPLLQACENLQEKDLTELFHFLAKNALISSQ